VDRKNKHKVAEANMYYTIESGRSSQCREYLSELCRSYQVRQELKESVRSAQNKHFIAESDLTLFR